MKESCVVLAYKSIILWYSPLMLYLGWLGACSHHDKTIPSHHKPLWSFIFQLVISLYALINVVLSLCMIMAIIALLVGRSQSFANLHLYWVWALLVHPTPKKPNYSKESTINSYAWCVTSFQVYSCFYISSKLNFCYVKISD